MKRSIAALSVLAIAGSATAQSSVTLFGVVDASVSHYTVKSNVVPGSPATTPPPSQSQTVLGNSGYNSSRVGFRGSEDLGGGLAAGFWLEGSLANDVGNVGFFQRRSTLSLTGGLGELRLGRDNVPTFWNDVIFDPMGAVGVGASLLYQVAQNLSVVNAGLMPGAGPSLSAPYVGTGLNGGLSGNTDNYTRASNSIGYFLPSGLGGFYGQVMYALPEGVKTSNAPNPNPSVRARYTGGRFGYASNGLDIALAYAESVQTDTAALKDTIKTLNLGASYDFGPVKLFGEFSRLKDDQRVSTTSPQAGPIYRAYQDSYRGAMIGATVPVGPGLIRASYGQVRSTNVAGTLLSPPAASLGELSSKATKVALSYVHNLSKRTALYTTVARIKVDDGQNNPSVMGASVNLKTYSYLQGNSRWAPSMSTGFDVGIRHAF
ncbi:porin [Variovorax sp. dw_954]|uniref:porin n=1 Tax=unclassified Variovorax TaxID=663243 RepID=UPI001BD51060